MKANGDMSRTNENVSIAKGNVLTMICWHSANKLEFEEQNNDEHISRT